MTTITVTYDPEKWRIVPVELVQLIQKWHCGDIGNIGFISRLEPVAKHMLSAAPTPPTGKTEAEIKAEALEEAAKICDSTVWAETIEYYMAMTKRDVAIRSMEECASNIRQLANQYRAHPGK